MYRKGRKYLFWFGIFLVVFFVLPNLINFREKRFFSDERRLAEAKAIRIGTDSVTVIPGQYYKRGKFFTYFFGEKNRKLWTVPIKAKTLNLDTTNGGMIPYQIGGSQQTISVRLKDSAGRHWALRSVNKDQQNALPPILRHSLLRFMFRDQVAAMNPYAPMIVSKLAEAAHLFHCNPNMYWIPYDQNGGEYNLKMTGRLAYLEEHLDSTWLYSFANAIEILDTDEMQALRKKQVSIDTLLYLKTRLFDMLICDWDRHEEQWKWILIDSAGKKSIKPIAKDRDMAMYIFDEGVLSQLTLAFNNKFQSFRENYKSIDGLMHQAKSLDKEFLKNVPKDIFLQIANEIRSELSASIIENALKAYPPEVYKQIGAEHKKIFISRLQKLTTTAERFYKLVND